LRVAEPDPRKKNILIRFSRESRMKFPDALGHLRIALTVSFEQLLGLMFQTIETCVGR
jgi:hypothetical protein